MLLKAVATVCAVQLGFSAISDDDFARVTIAQSFAESPRLDPSGTSWLPFPFWLNGSCMWLFGRSYEVARAASLLLSLGAAALVYLSARRFGLSRGASLCGGVLGAVLPHAVWLGYATVPEGYSAALGLFALSTLARDKQDSAGSVFTGTLAGAGALFAATLSRYEAWPLAAFFCGVLLWRQVGAPSKGAGRALLSGFIAALGPALWLMHGVFVHGDALFFITKVAAYRQAVGQASVSWSVSLLHYPSVLVRAEPELMSLLLLLCVPTIRRALPSSLSSALKLGGGGILAVLAFLIVGDLRDGAPTHHPERPLLIVWLGVALFASVLLQTAWRSARLWLLPSVLVLGALVCCRAWVTQRDSFIDRRAELAAGQLAREHAPSGRLLVDSADFGFFASIAGFGSPSRARALMDRDPRAPEPDPWTDAGQLSATLRRKEGDWLLARRPQWELGLLPGAPVAETSRFVLIRLEKSH
ncbi:MAG: hypothetical protein RJA70_2674 [Pseudomonadota bacterium]